MSEKSGYALIGVDLDTMEVVQMASLDLHLLDGAVDMVADNCFQVMLPIEKVRQLGGKKINGEGELRELMLSVVAPPTT